MAPQASIYQLRQVKLSAPKRTASSYASVENMQKYLDDLNSNVNLGKFKDIENMSPDKILSSKFKEPTILKD